MGQAVDVKMPLLIGGVDQWVSVQASDANAPVLLFLHGGPGTAQISFSRRSQRRLAEHFVVVNWDQRGAGRSFTRGLRPDDMTIERFVLDAEEVAENMLAQFGQARLYLVGHSWGSIVGARLAAKRPDLLHAYVGIGQVVDMQRGEEASYRFTLAEAQRLGHAKALRELQRIGPPPYRQLSDGGVQRKWLSRFQARPRAGRSPAHCCGTSRHGTPVPAMWSGSSAGPCSP